MPRLQVTDWLILAGATLLIGAGVASIGAAVGANVEAVETRQHWVDSGAAARAERAVAQPTPIWVTSAPAPSTSGILTSPGSVTTSKSVSTPQPVAVVRPTPDAAVVIEPQSVITLIDAGFVFLDPPQPGAGARLSISVSSAGPGRGAVTLAFPIAWLDGYRIANTSPPSSSGPKDRTRRRLVFAGLAPGVTTLQVDVVTTAEGFDPPRVHVEHAKTAEAIGEAHPPTVAPRPLPGPVSVLRIPRIGLNTAVVPTAWEPPTFVAGPLKMSANITQGNTVLVGHLSGSSGSSARYTTRLCGRSRRSPSAPIIASTCTPFAPLLTADGRRPGSARDHGPVVVHDAGAGWATRERSAPPRTSGCVQNSSALLLASLGC